MNKHTKIILNRVASTIAIIVVAYNYKKPVFKMLKNWINSFKEVWDES